MYEISIYCDETAHLLNDQQNPMVIGAIYTNTKDLKRVNEHIKKIKIKHGFTSTYPLEWTSIRRSHIEVMKEIIDYFFKHDLYFRSIVIDKNFLDHESYSQSHDTWYYKMFYTLLIPIIDYGSSTRVFLDIKDTFSGPKISELTRLLTLYSKNKNNIYNPFSDSNNGVFSDSEILNVQAINSMESPLMQLADVFIGAIRYRNVNSDALTDNAKSEIIKHLENEHNINLFNGDSRLEKKFNKFFWGKHGDSYE